MEVEEQDWVIEPEEGLLERFEKVLAVSVEGSRIVGGGGIV